MGMQTTLRLPPYSPDLNTMKDVFSKIKGILLLHKVEAHSHETLVKRRPVRLGAITAGDAQEFFDHRGYRSLGQLL